MLRKAVIKSMSGRYAVYSVNLLSMMILARIYAPETFGIVASITVFYTFFQILAEAGLGPAIINLEKLEYADRNGIFAVTLISGAVFGAIFYTLSPVFSEFYNISKVVLVVPYVAVSIFFLTASIVPLGFLLRDQAFLKIALAGLAAELVSSLVSIILVRWIDPITALATKALFGAMTNSLLLYYFSRDTEFGRPVWGSKLSAIKPLMSFSIYQFGFNVLNYFTRNLDNILVGKYLGAPYLGTYDKAYQIMRYPLMLLTFAMTPAIQPVVRKFAGDLEKVEAVHRNFVFKLSLAGAIAGSGMFLTSELIVRVLLGPQWTAVVPLIKILSVAIPVQVVLSSSGSFFQAMGRADLQFLSGALSAVVVLIGIIWGIYKKDMGVLAWALVITFHVNFIQAYYILYSRIFKKNMYKFFISMAPASLIVIFIVLLG